MLGNSDPRVRPGEDLVGEKMHGVKRKSSVRLFSSFYVGTLSVLNFTGGTLAWVWNIVIVGTMK